MTQTDNTLALRSRERLGTGGAKAARRAGLIPGILYGHGSTPLAIEIDAKPFSDLLAAGGRTHLLTIEIDGGARDTALVRDVQRHPVSHAVIHADLQRVAANEEVPATIAIRAVGTADGVKNQGGVLDVVVHTLDVRGPANALPDHLDVDVAKLRVHDHVTAAQVKLPPKFSLVTPPETIVVSIEPSKTAALVEEADVAAAEVAADVPTVDETAAENAS